MIEQFGELASVESGAGKSTCSLDHTHVEAGIGATSASTRSIKTAPARAGTANGATLFTDLTKLSMLSDYHR